MKKTEEQLENTDVFRTGADLVIEAGAGCGKTSQLVMLGQTPDAGRGVMIAFNKAVAVEAQSKFPSNVSCSTAHSLAFRAVVSRPCVQRLGGPPVQAKSLAEDFLGIRSWFNDVPKGRKAISSWKIASLAVQTVRRFCYSDDDEVQPWHVPWVEGITGEHEKSLRKQVLPFAREIWDDLQKGQGFARFEHDHYMKMWALEDPRIDADFLLVDESQDTNGVLAGVIRKQDHLQRVLVGDSQQRSLDGGARWTSCTSSRTPRSATFRSRSDSARRSPRRPTSGSPTWRLRCACVACRRSPLAWRRSSSPTRSCAAPTPTSSPRPWPLRTADKKVAVVGGTTGHLVLRRGGGRPALKRQDAPPGAVGVQDVVRRPVLRARRRPGGNFATAVRLIETYGTATVQEVAARCVDPRDADLVVSTVHKVKGLEWPRVQIDAHLVPEQSDGQTADGSKDELRVATSR
jgi:hypothetical protein